MANRSRCSICQVEGAVGPDGRCSFCRFVKAATDAGLSYGRLRAMIHDRMGKDMPEPSVLLSCPFCGKPFVPHHKRQLYCCSTCASRAATARYRQRKRGGT